MRQPTRCLWRVGAVWAILTGPIISRAQDDFEVAPQPQVLRVEAAEDQIVDAWIFRENRQNRDGVQMLPAVAGRARIESQLQQLFDELVRGCDLDEAQQQKLQLAARGDIKRFFDQVDAARKNYLKLKENREALNPFFQDQIVPLQTQYTKGLFGEGSMFSKTFRNTLTADQQAKYQAVLTARRKAAYKVLLESSLHKVVGGLRVEQLVKLQELLLEQTQPPLQFGPYDQQVIMLKLSQIPVEKLKEVLDKDQWKKIQPRLLQASGTEDLLAVNGVVEEVSKKPPVILRSVRTVIDAPAEAKQD